MGILFGGLVGIEANRSVRARPALNTRSAGAWKWTLRSPCHPS